MSVNAVTLERQSIEFSFLTNVSPKPTGIITRLFGCWHPHLGMPITSGAQTYRACIDCGAHRSFDTNSWTLFGPYYFEK